MSFRFPARWHGHESGPNPLTEALTARKAAGLSLIDLTISNPTIVGLPYPEDWPALLVGGGVADAGGAASPGIRGYDPDPRGLRSARRALVEYYATRGAINLNADDFFLTAGTSEGYAHLFKLLCEPGDTILVPRPSYPLLDTLADLAGLTLAAYPLVPTLAAAPNTVTSPTPVTAWAPDREALTSAITPRTKALVVVNPNNPTGSVLSADDAAWLLKLAEDRGLALIVDEVFADYRHDGRTTSLLTPSETGPLVFTLNGLSKLVGLPQLKLAWIHVAGEVADKAVATEALEYMCDAALSVGTAPQLACAGLLRGRSAFQGPIMARIAENLATLGALCAGHDRLKPLWPQGGWCLPVRCVGIDDDEAFAIRLVEETGVLVQPGYFFDFEDDETIVLSLLTPPEDFRNGVTRILTVLT
jgi:aspartate/methionine/tyrosine aminotransferase